MPEEAPALRDAPADGEPDAARRVRVARVVLDEAHEIARPRQPEADDARVGGAVDDVVDAAGLEAAVERDGAAVDEAPARSRDHLALRRRLVAHRHHVIRAVRIEHRIRLVIAIGDRRGRRPFVQNEIAADEAGDPPAVLGRDGHLHPHHARPLGNVPLPSHPEQREALTHEPAVAEVGVGRRIERRGGFAAAVADFVEQAAIAARGIDRLQHVEIGARFHLAARVARRERQVDDHRVAREIRIDAEVDFADELLVRSRGAELAAVQHDLAALDAQANDARLRGGRHDHDERRCECDSHRRPPTVTLPSLSTTSNHRARRARRDGRVRPARYAGRGDGKSRAITNR